ncbi:hypothetical protein DSO57_1029725 [Entomophthora muscae]|uniref:Uncharacterized protein n=1 Tax=Entomophthora muscae TaxID=34485 RepID=A0ACC2SE14_9FUNG|nr:hypothetical protein DSO57_1029725 [Entomophthora muscae]
MAAYPAKTDKETMNPSVAQKQADAPFKGKSSRSQKKNYRNKYNGENKNAAKPTIPETLTEMSGEIVEAAKLSTAQKIDTPVIPATASDEDKNHPATASAFEIGWMFVQQYYTFMNKSPRRLHCFYKAKSAMIRGNRI